MRLILKLKNLNNRYFQICVRAKKSGGFLFEISENLGVIDTLLSLAQKIVDIIG